MIHPSSPISHAHGVNPAYSTSSSRSHSLTTSASLVGTSWEPKTAATPVAGSTKWYDPAHPYPARITIRLMKAQGKTRNGHSHHPESFLRLPGISTVLTHRALPHELPMPRSMWSISPNAFSPVGDRVGSKNVLRDVADKMGLSAVPAEVFSKSGGMVKVRLDSYLGFGESVGEGRDSPSLNNTALRRRSVHSLVNG